MDDIQTLLDTAPPGVQIIALASLTTGGVINLIKRIPKVPSKWVPLVSVVAAFVITFVYHLLYNQELNSAAIFALEATAVGIIPAGGHAFIKPLWVAALGEESADKWLGQADSQESGDSNGGPYRKSGSVNELDMVVDVDDDEEPITTRDNEPSAKMRYSRLAVLFVIVAVPFSSGCAALTSFLTKAVAVTQTLDLAIDVAEAGAQAFFNRHPNPITKPKVDKLVSKARATAKAFHSAATAAKAADDKGLEAAKGPAVAAYKDLFDALAELGIKDALAPEGGAENALADLPEPLDLTTPEEVAVALEFN